MYQILDESEGRVIGIRATGTLTEADYDYLLPRLRTAIEEWDRIRVLLELDDLDGITPAALWDEVTFDLAALQHVERLAVVGDASWEEALEGLAQPFLHADARFFARGQKPAAWQWLRDGSGDDPAPAR